MPKILGSGLWLQPEEVSQTVLCQVIKFTHGRKIHETILNIVRELGFVYDPRYGQWWVHKTRVSDADVAAMLWDIQLVVAQNTPVVEAPRGPRPLSGPPIDARCLAVCATCGRTGQPAKEKWINGAEGPRCCGCNAVRNTETRTPTEQRLDQAAAKYRDALAIARAKLATSEQLLDLAHTDIEILSATIKRRDAEIAVLRSELQERGAAREAKPVKHKGVVIHCQNDEDY
jgi:hypothetical protein